MGLLWKPRRKAKDFAQIFKMVKKQTKKHDRRSPKLDLVFPDSPDLVVGTACGGMTYSPIIPQSNLAFWH
jgi:hypothetical protein